MDRSFEGENIAGTSGKTEDVDVIKNALVSRINAGAEQVHREENYTHSIGKERDRLIKYLQKMFEEAKYQRRIDHVSEGKEPLGDGANSVLNAARRNAQEEVRKKASSFFGMKKETADHKIHVLNLIYENASGREVRSDSSTRPSSEGAASSTNVRPSSENVAPGASGYSSSPESVENIHTVTTPLDDLY